MALIKISNAQLAYGDHALLDKAEFLLHSHERVCLVGRNGAGKSTLMKVIAGEVLLDDGTVQRQNELVVSRLEQDPPRNAEGSVFDYVAEGLADAGRVLREYHHQLDLVTEDPSEANINKLARIQEQVDHHNGWQLDTRIAAVLESLKLEPTVLLTDLSGGWQRKAALARALVCNPDILLLDEPTNHLDVTTIEWLEGFLKDFRGSIIFISHDRAFIRSMATRIVDLDRGQLTSFPGDYEGYLDGKEEMLRVQAEQNSLFDKKLAQEEVWIRQGVKARRTRNEGRVRALKALRNERSDRRDVVGKADMQLQDANRSGKIVFEAKNISYSYGDKPIVNDFSFNVMRGDRIALIGANGCGKSTLIKVMLDQLQVTGGDFHCGTKLEVAYFDQYREILDPEKTVIDNLADGKQEVTINGKTRHALGYLQDFLFHPRRARTPVKALSGGEKNRLLLAKLFLKPNNLLVLDEPTNDLDIETLELLEDILANYQGTLLLVSHDRQFVDNTVTTSWIFEGDGVVNEYVGGYHDAQSQRANSYANQAKEQAAQIELAKKKKAEQEQKQQQETPKRVGKKLSFTLQHELAALPKKIEDLENEIAKLQVLVNDPAFFSDPKNDTQATLTALTKLEAEFEVAFERWEELDAM
ncbi:ATP-binding cassette ATPase Uup [Photobacterium carnosum]|uniref:ATP-binding protein Uup n=1 Tax=Photobacterium carnosum TaxID=2023717 RepID=A0A2N4UTG9_9GAMM|nr:ABC transporter ATP-binding protein [Photobacterium carnosum]KAE8178405.1 ABC transporter ATP-binding protein [Photobacterium carnosum]MBY3789989.1 ABC transporter ATP-binding protein [Photobacterium carnosum]MCD9496173.1 ABC transporter ATP-binding protein [Photobacterium carnosum]MCD9498633.1 ABC transporter ATP-binding protein [Photobacterium carnosum]MCD9516213.1 ABC transporter ATP-binding protein [Photobacterium carnosum]